VEVLSIGECRRLIGPECTLDDDTVLALRDQLYALAFVARATHRSYEARIDSLPEADRLEVEERAAIFEFDAKMPRSQAERLALTRRTRHRRQ
jgi:hypothetical protein